MRLAHGELLLLQIDDEDGIGLPFHVRHAAEIRLELLEVGLHTEALLRREQGELAVRLETPEIVEVRDALRDRPPVREQSTEPAVVDVRHADSRRMFRDGVLRLLLGSDEEHRPAALGDVPGEVVRLLEQFLRLREVDQVDAPALTEDVAAHLGVPATRLMAEVDAGLQQLSHRDD